MNAPAHRMLVLLCILVLLAAACGDNDTASTDTANGSNRGAESESRDGDDAETSGESGGGAGASGEIDDDGLLHVPDEYPSIQAAVDGAAPGELVLIAEGTYAEAVDVTTDRLVIRGTDRNTVVLDGEFELQNGIRVLGADGVSIENLTARNYTKNGFFWTTDVDGYRGSYLSAIRNGDYGMYAFGARNGILEHSYGAGSPDAGFYIGQCYPCNALIDDVISEYNGLGYSGTNSGGDLYIINSTFRFNRSGVLPNSGTYEGCAPERETTVAGNLVYDNNETDGPAIAAAILNQGTGIVVTGGLDNLIESNRIGNHDVAGIGITAYAEENPINAIPEPPDSDCLADAEAGSDEVVADLPRPLLWPATDNVVRGNVIDRSGVADIINAQPMGNNRFCDNQLQSTIPEDLQTLAPCEGEQSQNGDDLGDPIAEIAAREARLPSGDYQTYEFEAQTDLPGMDDPLNAPAVPADNIVIDVDIDAIGVPEMPADA